MDWLALPWKVLVVRGVLGLLAGLATVLWPLSTVVALVVLLGVWALVDGVETIVAGARAPETAAKVGLVALGVLSVVAGLLVTLRPISSAVTLTWVLGLWLIVRGVIEAAQAFVGPVVGSRVMHLAAAALSALAGVLLAANPGRAALGLTVWLGVVIGLWGAVLLVTGLLSRREQGRRDRGSAPAGVAG